MFEILDLIIDTVADGCHNVVDTTRDIVDDTCDFAEELINDIFD